ncbi:hypothetical protein GCM10010245_25270 [Streptomyces spectabilis]|uniref:Uncharacterized protein n=1 Tax=Streptomyces spectabilis TaxID=68270 RepID=A0A7W8ET46_STRST|nr:hypothetical protein [Streptomyces spectabilis]GGV14543.1 hypothetical protein GCM10010245_25270 [Streptomyces spectabilis]
MTAARRGHHPRPTDSALWKSAKGYGAGAKPSKRDYAPGSWVTWTTPRGKSRTGIVTTDPVTVAQVKRTAEVGGARDARTRAAVIPSDGGDTVPLCLPNSNNPDAQVKDNGRWRNATPAHNQSTHEEAQAA